MYMLKTPLYMGSAAHVANEADQVEVNKEDEVNKTLKTLLIVRALTLDGKFDQLKGVIQSILAGESAQQKANV